MHKDEFITRVERAIEARSYEAAEAKIMTRQFWKTIDIAFESEKTVTETADRIIGLHEHG